MKNYVPAKTISNKTRAIFEAYGSGESFLIRFNPDNGKAYTKDEEDAIMGTYPCLSELNEAYGKNDVKTFIMIQVRALNEFVGTANRMSTMQIEKLAEAIYDDFYFFKVTEILLFFKYFRGGRFGRFYGSVDPLFIMSCLWDFKRLRDEKISIFETRMNQAKREAERKENPPMSYEEYLRLKERAANGDEEAKQILKSK